MRKIPAFFQEKCIFFGLGLVWLSIVGLLFAATVYKHPLQIYNIAMLIALAKDYLHSMWTMCFMHLLMVATWAIPFIFPSYLATILLAYNDKLGRATAYINVMQGGSLPYTCWIWTQWLCVCTVCVGCLAALIVPDIPSSLFVLYSLFAKEICTRKWQKPCYITGELDLILFQGQVFGKCVCCGLG